MSRRHRRQEHRSSFPWPIVVFGGILLIAAAVLLLVNQNGGGGSGTPAIAVDQSKIDYGYVQFGNDKSFSIKVTNAGDGLLRFKAKPYIQVMEGCWPPDLAIGSMALKPGESTTVQSSVFMMHPGMDGPHDFAIHLITNDPKTPDLVVHVSSVWGP